MKKVLLVLAVAAVLASCVSSPQAPDTGAAAAGPSSASGSDAEVTAIMAKARESIEANRLAEGLRFYVSAMGRADRAGLTARLGEIQAILKEIEGRLTVEPHESWLAADGSQVSGDSRSAAKGAGPMPAVYLYESYGFAKSPVADAVMRFEFVSNGGSLTASVSTDARGMANTSITKLDSPGKDAVVRAYPVFSADGFSYAVRSVYRDFSYLSPPNIALVAALERTPAGDSENPRVLDAVAAALGPLGVQAVPLNGVVNSGRFGSAFAGDPGALAALAPAVKAGYYALVLVEVGKPSKMVYAGKEYNIFIASGKATLRLVRSDGTIVHSEVRDGVRGQGGTEADAIADCFVKIREELATAIGARSEEIRAALAQ